MTERVLVVDDDDRIRGVVRAVLEGDGLEVVEAADGETALAILAREGTGAPRLVVLDVMMPGLDGVEVCRRIDTDRTRVLMLTARDDPETFAASEAAGAAGYIAKPFSAIGLLDAVEGLRVR